MGLGNNKRMSAAELRESVQPRSAPSEEPSSRFGFVLAVLAILVPASSVYAWRSGKLEAVLSDFKTGGAVAESAAVSPHGGAAPAQAGLPPQIPASPPSAGAAAKASDVSRNHVYSVDDYLYGRASQSFIDHAHGGGAGLLAAGMTMSHLQEIRDPVDLKLLRDEKIDGIKEGQLRINCNRRADRYYREASASDAGLSRIAAYGEEVACLLMTKPERLCDKSEREYLSRRFRHYTVQIIDYGRSRDRAVERAGVTEKERAVRAKAELNAALQRGVHQSIRMELIKLSSAGWIKEHDFAVTPPNVVLLNVVGSGAAPDRSCKA